MVHPLNSCMLKVNRPSKKSIKNMVFSILRILWTYFVSFIHSYVVYLPLFCSIKKCENGTHFCLRELSALYGTFSINSDVKLSPQWAWKSEYRKVVKKVLVAYIQSRLRRAAGRRLRAWIKYLLIEKFQESHSLFSCFLFCYAYIANKKPMDDLLALSFYMGHL